MGAVFALRESPTLDLSSAVAEFLADCRLRGLSPETIKWYKYALGPFERFVVAEGYGDVASVSDKNVRAFLSEQATRVGPRRVNHYREAICRFYEWLRTEEYVHINPAERIGKVREPQKLISSFTEAELEALFKQPDVSAASSDCVTTSSCSCCWTPVCAFLRPSDCAWRMLTLRPAR